jgi:hypothetical protein
MSVFFSDKTKLHLIGNRHSQDDRYTEIKKSSPLSIEIAHIAYGNIRDAWGTSEVLISTWAKTSALPKPAPRVINAMRKGIKEFDHLSSFGAAEYGNPLVFYTPAYSGNTLRLSVELLEIDRIGEEKVQKLGKGLASLSKLAIFVPQLATLSMSPDILKISVKLLNLFNRNDTVLFGHLDLNLDRAKLLTSGRYVFVEGDHPDDFIDKYKLNYDHKLVTNDGAPAEDDGMVNPYVVLRFDGRERSEYKDFELDSEVQSQLARHLNEEITTELADFMSTAVATSIKFKWTNKVLKLKRQYNRLTDEGEKTKKMEEINEELKRFSKDHIDLLKEALSL